jgi:hypothetical protein
VLCVATGPAIALDDYSTPGYFDGGQPAGQAALAWDGRTLFVAWDRNHDLTNSVTEVTEMVLQRYAFDAGLISQDGPWALDVDTSGAGTTGLALDATNQALFFGWSGLLHSSRSGRAARVELDGGITWLATLDTYCWRLLHGGRPQFLQVNGDVIIGYGMYNCAGSAFSSETFWLDANTGLRLPNVSSQVTLAQDGMRPDLIRGEGGFAREPSTGLLYQVYGRWYENDLRMRAIDTASPNPMASNPVGLGSNVNAEPVAAFNGPVLAIAATEESPEPPLLTIRVGAPDAGTLSQRKTITPHADKDFLVAPVLVAAGSGFALLDTFVPSTYFVSGSYPQEHHFITTLYHLDAAGNVVESMPLDTGGALYPAMIWAGGRLAITWVHSEPINMGLASSYQRFLRWVDCP